MVATTPDTATAAAQPAGTPAAAMEAGRRMPAHIEEVIAAAHAYAIDPACTYEMLLARIHAAALTDGGPKDRTGAAVQLSHAKVAGKAGTQHPETPPPGVPAQRRTSDDQPTWMNSTQRALHRIRGL